MSDHASDDQFDVAVDGGSLRVWAWGPASGPPVIVLHGITAHGRGYRALAAALPECRVMAPDLRGRGASRHIEGPFSMAAHAADVAAVLDAAGTDRATVVGHSMGGFAAIVFAHHHPDRVAGLVLVDGGVPLDLPEAVLAMPIEDLTLAVIGPALERLRRTFSSVEEHRALWRQHPALADDWGPIVEAYVDEDLTGEPPELRSSAREDAVLADAESELVHDDIPRAVAELDRPMTVVAAEFGLLAADAPPLYAPEHLDAFAAEHPQTTVVRVAGVNHYTIALSERGCEELARHIRAVL